MRLGAALGIGTCVALTTVAVRAQQPPGRGEAFRFRSAVELINVTATVTDNAGRFVPNLQREDFHVFEDGQEQPITHFSRDRVPVSLGIALDTSSSMEGEKIIAARGALRRFLYELLDPADELFLFRFDDAPQLVEGWTTDRDRLQSKLGRIEPEGATAMYDALAQAVSFGRTGRNRKKALVLISDGNDTSSESTPFVVKRLIRESEVIVYAVGIDANGTIPTWSGPRDGYPLPPREPSPLPFPWPRRRLPNTPPRTPPHGVFSRGGNERVNVQALRDITDDSGGRTEIVRDPRDLGPATAGIADELSRQYSLGYPSTGKHDGRWHSIRVEVRNASYTVRARRGYVAATEH
jgi:Ca-activated chloride channel family protein